MTAETLAPPARVVAHLACLERAAADPDAIPAVRRMIHNLIAERRVKLALLGADLKEADRG